VDKDARHLHLDDGGYGYITIGVPLSTKPGGVLENATTTAADALPRAEKAVLLKKKNAVGGQ
jgi:hypothetical protein